MTIAPKPSARTRSGPGLSTARSAISPAPGQARGDDKCEIGPHFTAAARDLCGLAGALFGWRLGEFWAATPAEFAAMLTPYAPGAGGAGIDRATFDRLKERFPDG